MSFREYLKENFKRPSLAEMKQKAQESWMQLTLCFIYLAVTIIHEATNLFTIQFVIAQFVIALGVCVWGILTVSFVWEDYQAWRVKHGP
jgi:hypothetical protein